MLLPAQEGDERRQIDGCGSGNHDQQSDDTQDRRGILALGELAGDERARSDAGEVGGEQQGEGRCAIEGGQREDPEPSDFEAQGDKAGDASDDHRDAERQPRVTCCDRRGGHLIVRERRFHAAAENERE